MTSYFLLAGEASGDLHGSHLIRAFRASDKHVTLRGVGGPLMQKEGLESFLSMDALQVMGFSDVIPALPRLWKMFYRIRDLILKLRPACVILIDYPGFNLRLARALRKKGFNGKIVQYICPTLWAHGKQRIHTLIAYFDLVLSIFPFENTYIAHTPLKMIYIGNPLTEILGAHPYQTDWMQQIGFPHNENLIALFPGSRRAEIEQHAPIQLRVAAAMKEHHPQLRFGLSCGQEGMHSLLHDLILQNRLHLQEDVCIVPSRFRYELMQTCKTALAKSGTVTLELALHHVPTVVHYELSFLNYVIAKHILRLRLPHYCIVNILGQATIFPEWIARHVSDSDLKDSLTLVHSNPVRRASIRQACEKIQQQLNHGSSSQCAVQAIQELISC